MTSSSRHYRILGLSVGCTAREARHAYHQRAKQYHPDLAPAGEHRRRQLAMMRINEAYVAILADITAEEDGDTAQSTAQRNPSGDGASVPEPSESSGTVDAEFLHRWKQKISRVRATTREVGSLRDPAYVYYKAGFKAYRTGASMLYRKEGRQLRHFLQNGGTFDAYVLRLVLQALRHFEQSYRYFLVVIERYPGSPWVADAQWKLHRLERYNAIYQRICENLSRSSGRGAMSRTVTPS